MTKADLGTLRWRTGRKVGRTIYAQHGDEPSGADTLIGMMDTERLASRVVTEHNVARRARLEVAAALSARNGESNVTRPE